MRSVLSDVTPYRKGDGPRDHIGVSSVTRCKPYCHTSG
jgi:hypothetical protein